MIYLVRHAKAGERGTGDDDWLRPLTRPGRAQAAGLLRLLADAHIERIVSSPFVRCVETVAPLAGARGLAIEVDDALAEGAPLDEALALVRKHADAGAVLCSHGDVIPAVLEHAASRGVDLGPDPRWPKGSTWVLDVRHGEVRAATYVPPPPDA
jgi:8-oxo-dGTP diphosphatase